jgi:hypothetical protein
MNKENAKKIYDLVKLVKKEGNWDIPPLNELIEKLGKVCSLVKEEENRGELPSFEKFYDLFCVSVHKRKDNGSSIMEKEGQSMEEGFNVILFLIILVAAVGFILWLKLKKQNKNDQQQTPSEDKVSASPKSSSSQSYGGYPNFKKSTQESSQISPKYLLVAMETKKFTAIFSDLSDLSQGRTFTLQNGKALYAQSPYLLADQTLETVTALKEKCTGSGKWVILSIQVSSDLMEKLCKEKTIGDKREGFEQMEKASVSILGYLGEVPKADNLSFYGI